MTPEVIAARALLSAGGYIVVPCRCQQPLRDLASAVDARTSAGREVGELKDQLAKAEQKLRDADFEVARAYARIEALARGAS